MNKILFKRKHTFLINILIFILLNFIYKNSISLNYSYMGFTVNNFNLYKYLYSFLFVILISFLTVYKTTSDYSKIASQLIISLFTFPSLILYLNTTISIEISIAHLIFFFIAFYFIEHINIKPFNIVIREDQRLYFLCLLIILISIPFLIKFSSKINFKNFLLIDIYESRLLQKNNSNIFLSYLYSQMTNVILPITLIYTLINKKFKLSYLISIAFLYFFLIGAHKSVLFGFIIVLLYYKFNNSAYYFSYFIFFILTIDILSFKIFNNFLISGLITRRLFFIPALLDKYYFIFFNNKPLYWSSSFLSSIIDNPFKLSPPYIIGKYYFNNRYMSANNGLISDGFTNLGWVGILINILAFSLYFTYLKSLNINKLYFSIIVLLMISFLSSSLPVVLLTHGGILLILLCQLTLKDSNLIHD